MKTLLLTATSLVLVATGSAFARPVAPAPSAPQVQQRSMRIHRQMQTRDQVVAHVRAMFARFDTNHDGFVTKDEVAAAKRERVDIRRRMDERMGGHDAHRLPPLADRGSAFDRLDANHDGVITRDEFVNARPQMFKREIRIVRGGPDGEMGAMRHMGRGGMMKHMFAMADANHDGRLSLDEATTAALRHFDMADANHNGRLDPGEHMRMRRPMDGNAPR